MAALVGEENIATLFGDIHYFYGTVDIKPRHHRFDKGSYVYLFENATDKRCRIEIANQPGTDDQDAFDGSLDHARMRYSYKQQCMVSLFVAGHVDQNEWHLPTFDPRNETKYHYKIHSLDIYFWSQRDALEFVNGIRRVLPPSQVEILDELGSSHDVGSILQTAESAAMSTSHYGDEASLSQQTFRSLSESTHNAQSLEVAPMPPPLHAPATAPKPDYFIPMAYNPAAPAAPEVIKHREKTPPPDEDPLNPLAVAVAHDYQKQPFTPALPISPRIPFAVRSPGLSPGGIDDRVLSPHLPGMQIDAPISAKVATASAVSNGSPATLFPVSSTPSPPPPPPPATSSPLSSMVAQTASDNRQSLGVGPSHFPPSYRHSGAQGSQDYSIHQQFYRPADEELGANHHHQYQPKTEGRGRLEESASRLERGVSGMLKKFERKFG